LDLAGQNEGLGLEIIESATLRYLLSLPPARSEAEDKVPIICFLHGYDEAAPVEIHRGLTRHGPLRSIGELRALKRCIVIAPQLPMAGDIWHRYANAVRSIVTEMQENQGGDPRRSYLTGFSFGGNGVFDLALLQADLWAALWPVDPTRIARLDPKRPIWLSFGAIARSKRSGFIQALHLKAADDERVGDRLYLDQGQDRVGSAALAYRDERIYAWLLSKHL
jgi:predicted peptidase